MPAVAATFVDEVDYRTVNNLTGRRFTIPNVPTLSISPEYFLDLGEVIGGSIWQFRASANSNNYEFSFRQKEGIVFLPNIDEFFKVTAIFQSVDLSWIDANWINRDPLDTNGDRTPRLYMRVNNPGALDTGIVTFELLYHVQNFRVTGD